MIGIVILNYNTWHETIVCIQSIERYTKSNYHIYVVDNDSTEQLSKSDICFFKDKDYIDLIFSKHNCGYAAGNNIGLEKAKADSCDTYFICNSDIKMIDNTIDKLTYYLKDNPSCGIAGPVLLNEKNELQTLHMKCKLTLRYKYINMLFMKSPLKILCRSFINNFFIKPDILKPLQVFAVSGCFFAISKDCMDYLFPLDEHTFLYEEELLIGCSLENTEFKTYIVPSGKVIHAHGISTKKVSGFSQRCMMESEIYYCREYIRSHRLLLFPLSAIRYLKYLITDRSDNLRFRLFYFLKILKKCFK